MEKIHKYNNERYNTQALVKSQERYKAVLLIYVNKTGLGKESREKKDIPPVHIRKTNSRDKEKIHKYASTRKIREEILLLWSNCNTLL